MIFFNKLQQLYFWKFDAVQTVNIILSLLFIVSDLRAKKIYLLNLLLALPFLLPQILIESVIMTLVVLLSIQAISKIQKKIYIQTGDNLLLMLYMPTIQIERIPILLFFIGIMHILWSLVYMKIYKNKEIPMAPSIVIPWLILYFM